MRAKTEVDPNTNSLLTAAGREDSAGFFRLLECDAKGLSQSQVQTRRIKFGSNDVVSKRVASWQLQLLHSFLTPFNALLIIVAAASLITNVVAASDAELGLRTITLIASMIFLSSLMRFWQEFRSSRAADKLRQMVRTSVLVLRSDVGKHDISINELVPGDVVLLSAGDMIPADCRVVQSKDLFVSQSVLTGESMPLEKNESIVTDESITSPLDFANICFMGTNVVSGSATVLVLTTGKRTYFGSISSSISEGGLQTSFEKGVNRVSWMLLKLMFVIVPLVFLINGFTKGDWIEALLFAITIAVGLTPEMLPMIVTTNLARGAISMSKERVIVKRLNAIQNIGAMDVLCTDKTGTLTMDKIVMEVQLNINGENDLEVLKWAYLNSYYQTGLKNQTDVAILEHDEVDRLLKTETRYKKIDEIPFDFQRRRMSVILEQSNNTHLLVCKGAPEELLQVCTHAFDPGADHELHIENDEVIELDDKMRSSIVNVLTRCYRDGLRTLIVAVKIFNEQKSSYSVTDEHDLILTGIIGFLDPAKPTAAEALQAMQRLGVQVKVLTGDNDIVTQKICQDVGLPLSKTLLGNDINSLSDETLGRMVDEVNVFAKLTPIQKSRIIKILQSKGHTVGFLGDGINDAPALHDADVGISVDTAVDIAKESAGMILLEKDLMVLRKGIIYGRRTFGNIIKYIKMAVSSNYGNILSVVGASILLPFLPLLPIQILTQNLLYDASQISIPWDTMDEEFILRPQKWDASGIQRFMLFIGPVSSIFDYVTFAVLFFLYAANTPLNQSFFQSGWFMEGLISQTLIVHMIRTRRIPFIQSRAAIPVVIGTILIAFIGLYLPYSFLAQPLRLTPLPASYFAWLAAIVLAYSITTQFVKQLFIRKFRYWL